MKNSEKLSDETDLVEKIAYRIAEEIVNDYHWRVVDKQFQKAILKALDRQLKSGAFDKACVPIFIRLFKEIAKGEDHWCFGDEYQETASTLVEKHFLRYLKRTLK